MVKGKLAQAICLALMAGSMSSHAAPAAAVKNATDSGYFGLFPANSFLEANGSCTDCVDLKQGMWYFRDEVVALPKPGFTMAGFSKTAHQNEDVREWYASGDAKKLDYPSLIWIGSQHVIDTVTMSPDLKQLKTSDGDTINLELVPKIATNRSYFDASSQEFFKSRSVKLRGNYMPGTGTASPSFIARTIWPKDFAIDPNKLTAAPLSDKESPKSFVQADDGGAKGQFTTRLIWERHLNQVRNWQDKAVLGIMLNGAQGDDDESMGGHFAVATGRYQQDGDWSNWMVNSIYNLDSFSEKGIVAAMTPMDNYLMDLNSGQQYYRPSYMLVAVLNDARTVQAYQGGIERTYNHFYRHDFVYEHASANCAGIGMDVFTHLGWHIPERGPTGYLKAIGAYGYLAAKDKSLASGRKIYDYLTEEQTRLLPAVAFDAAGQDLLSLVQGKATRGLTPYEQQLHDDVEALVLVRIPQVPSSRVFGSNPVFSFEEYMKRTPADHSKWKIVPVDARPFPHELRDGLALEEPTKSSVPGPIATIIAILVLGIGYGIRKRLQKRS
jgi:hypothetical protein